MGLAADSDGVGVGGPGRDVQNATKSAARARLVAKCTTLMQNATALAGTAPFAAFCMTAARRT
jgi:hypothetical protein